MNKAIALYGIVVSDASACANVWRACHTMFARTIISVSLVVGIYPVIICVIRLKVLFASHSGVDSLQSFKVDVSHHFGLSHGGRAGQVVGRWNVVCFIAKYIAQCLWTFLCVGANVSVSGSCVI